MREIQGVIYTETLHRQLNVLKKFIKLEDMNHLWRLSWRTFHPWDSMNPWDSLLISLREITMLLMSYWTRLRNYKECKLMKVFKIRNNNLITGSFFNITSNLIISNRPLEHNFWCYFWLEDIIIKSVRYKELLSYEFRNRTIGYSKND